MKSRSRNHTPNSLENHPTFQRLPTIHVREALVKAPRELREAAELPRLLERHGAVQNAGAANLVVGRTHLDDEDGA